MSFPIQLTGCGHFLPNRIVPNSEICSFLDTTDEWIVERTGIRQRHVADEGQGTSDLSVPAAKRALERARLKPEELDLIVVATSTPDMLMPNTASIVQHAIGATNAAAFDVEAACAGFTYAFAIACQFVASGTYRKVLVIGADVMSKFLNWNDRSTCILFGDGAGAVVLERGEEQGVHGLHLGADGAGRGHIMIPLGSRVPPSAELIESGGHTMQMRGREVYKFAVDIVPKAIAKVLEQAELTLDDLQHVLLHQANLRIMEAVAKRMGLSSEKMLSNVDRVANTSGASIPIALSEAVLSGKVKKGDRLAMVGFGAGLTWGASLVTWNGPLERKEP
ncbi:MAG TPA: 3-oxoacyl-ACP synthase [Cyanobacteria bacterium UBA8530]|nr:3-oxoacyl-ACP synthase [Cyanobacteria bacterium UBA8530]